MASRGCLALPTSLLPQYSVPEQQSTRWPHGLLASSLAPLATSQASALHKEATSVLRGAGGGGRYKMMRIAQAADSKQQLEILGRFGRGAPS